MPEMLTWLCHPPTLVSSMEGEMLENNYLNTKYSLSPSGVMDQHSLTSDPRPPLSHRYVAGVLKDGKW